MILIQKHYKCLALSSISKPAGVVSPETGMVPFNLFKLRSSHDSNDKLPMEGGIGPVKLLEFKELPSDKVNKVQ